MLTTQSQQTVPAVPIGMKKAQENVAGSMGSNPGAPGPQVPSSTENSQKNTLKKPKKKLSIKYILGGLVLLLLLIGAGAGFYLTQISQDVRQQASGCVYWNGDPAQEGDIDNRGGIRQECKNGLWTTPSDGNTNPNLDAGTVTPVSDSPTLTPGSGDSGECALGDSQAIRDCLASKETVYNSGSCNGLTESECLTWCENNPDCSVQTCTGTQQKSGEQKGEFTSCGGSGGTGGCGQVDMLGPDGELLGFVMDTTGCEGDGAPAATTIVLATSNPTTNPTTNPTSNPTQQPSPTPLAVCNETCSADTDCGEANHSCIGEVCRLTSNPESVTCEEAVAVGCGEPCQVSTDCAEANHACLESTDDGNPSGGVCRLISNPTSTTCVAATPEPSPTPTVGCNDACVTSSDCSDTDHSCNASTNSCRLTENPGDENCAPAVEPAPGCNEECYASTDCSNSSAVCYDNLCRLSTNPANTSCQPKQIAQETGTYYEQPDLPQALPESGSEDILNWLKVGLGALGLGLIFLFL